MRKEMLHYMFWQIMSLYTNQQYQSQPKQQLDFHKAKYINMTYALPGEQQMIVRPQQQKIMPIKHRQLKTLPPKQESPDPQDTSRTADPLNSSKRLFPKQTPSKVITKQIRSKLPPKNIPYDKQTLYAQVLSLKISLNQALDQNIRLRQFYEERQKEWRCIITQQRQCIQNYTHNRNQYQADICFPQKSLVHHHNLGRSHQNLLKATPAPPLKKNPVYPKHPNKKVIRLSTEGRFHRRIREEQQPKKQGHYMRQMQQITNQQELWAQRSDLLYQSIIKGLALTAKHPGQDQIMDRIMRKTYCRLKHSKVSLGQLQQSEHMKKLRQAKSTTKERMAKTIRKLGFAVEGNEMPIFLQSLERQVKERFGELKGEWVVELIMGRLAQCKKMTEGSHSEIERFAKDCDSDHSSQLKAVLPIESALHLKHHSAAPQILEPGINTMGTVQDLSTLIHKNDTCPAVDQKKL